MKNILSLISLCFVVVFTGCKSSTLLNEERLRGNLDDQVLSVVEKYRDEIPTMMTSNDIPALTVTIVDREGIVWSGGYGVSNRPRGIKTSLRTLFSIQSNSKTFAALAVMIAVQEGLLDLDVPISTYIPKFKVNSCYEDEPQNRITLRHLLNHTSGLAHEAPVGNNIDASYPSFEAHIKSIEDTWLRGKVGEHYFYSNLGIDLAVWILQEVSKESYSAYLKEHVLIPLGLTESLVDPEALAKNQNIALGFVSPFVKPGFVSIPMLGAGGVYSNATDIGKLMQFFLNGGMIDGKVVLKSEYINEMYTPTLASGSYGLGIDRIDENGTFSLNHNGKGFGFNATMKWYPDFGIGCCVMTNEMGNDDPHIVLCDNILSDLIRSELYDKNRIKSTFNDPIDYRKHDSLVEPSAGAELHSSFKPKWSKYIGTYALIPNGYEFKWYAKLAFKLGYTPEFLKFPVYEKDGKLWLGRQPISEYSEGLFFNPWGQCLDLQSEAMTWRNMKVRKID